MLADYNERQKEGKQVGAPVYLFAHGGFLYTCPAVPNDGGLIISPP